MLRRDAASGVLRQDGEYTHVPLCMVPALSSSDAGRWRLTSFIDTDGRVCLTQEGGSRYAALATTADH